MGSPRPANLVKKRRTASCFYHPAPLTRDPKNVAVRGTHYRAERLKSPLFSTPGQGESDSGSAFTPITRLSSTGEPESRPGCSFCIPTEVSSLPTGYLGPTSFVAALEEDRELVSSPSDLQLQDGAGTAPLAGLPLDCVQKTVVILSCLKDFPTIEQLVREYYKLSPAAVILPLILHALPSIRTMIDETQLHKSPADQVALVLRNTKQMFQVPHTITGRQFHELFTGSNLRLEILAIFYSIAGRISLFGLAHDRFPKHSGIAARERFARQMLAVSDAILQICKLLTPVNDLTIWMLYEILLLSKVAHGDSSSAKWRRLGELSTHLFELGLHRDPQQPNALPMFLVESRRRLFAAAYHLDKSIATFLGRPPRISFRHSDCRLPLDINDNALEGDLAELEVALQSLDSEGWNTQGVIQRASLLRQRFLISTFREEILEVSLLTQNQETANKLRDISLRCHQTWDSCPERLRYSSEYRDDNIPTPIRLMLIVLYLAYLYNDFLIQRLLVQQNPEAQSSLLEVSSTILATVLAFCALREDMIDLRPDFVWTSLLYGFPSAGVLVKALQNQVRTGRPIPYRGSRSVLIRHLSVFISHLESMSRPDVVNYGLFQRASKIFSNIIDEVLEPRVSVTLPGPDLGTLSDADIGMIGGTDDLDFLDILEYGGSIDQFLF
ncbi:hypothetical protein BBP40_005550 [Aspergillus hancockii]|nr:hypothetical protein BBP40_005550 [Aspergillus hancockii]